MIPIIVKGPALMGSCQLIMHAKGEEDRSLLAVSKCCNVGKEARKTRVCKAGFMWGLHILCIATHNHAAAHIPKVDANFRHVMST